MAPRLVVEFTKYSGAGNDFIVIDDRFYHFSQEELRSIAQRQCARRTGIGADGLLVLQEAEGVDFRMRYLNADGTTGTMCGNGARCLARYARSAGKMAEPLVFETDAGLYSASVPESGPVRLFVPPHRSYATCTVENTTVHTLWTGTEHAVVFVSDVDSAPVSSRGPALRHNPTVSPTGSNVNFVEVAGDDTLRVRTWEKGVEGETLACGTGATASAVAARVEGKVSGQRITVEMPGGTLIIGLRAHDGVPEYLEGPAEAVFRGTFEL